MASRWQELADGIGEVALQAGRNLDALVALFAAANQFAERHPEAGPAEFINEQLERDIPQDTLAHVSRDDQKVTLATSLRKSKTQSEECLECLRTPISCQTGPRPTIRVFLVSAVSHHQA